MDSLWWLLADKNRPEEMRFAARQVPKQSPACPSISLLAINHGPSAELKARIVAGWGGCGGKDAGIGDFCDTPAITSLKDFATYS